MPRTAAGAKRFRCDSQAVVGDVARVWLCGEIDASDAWAINVVLHDTQLAAALTILDLRGVSALGPALAELVTAADERALEQGRRLVILHGPGTPRVELEALCLHAGMLSVEEPAEASVDPPDRAAVATAERTDSAVIRVWGELDTATGPELAAALAVQAARRRSTLLDLRGVDFMDSTGIRLLLQSNELARRDGLGFELIPSEAVARTLEVAGLRDRFACVRPQL